MDVLEAKKSSIAVFCSKYLLEKMALISEKYHLPCKWSQYLMTEGSKALKSGSSSFTSKYSSDEVMETVPGAAIPGLINIAGVLMLTGP